MKTKLTRLAAAAVVAAAAGCSNPADSVPAAAVGPASASAAVDATPEGEAGEPADADLATSETADADPAGSETAAAEPAESETASASQTPAPSAPAVRTFAFGLESSKIEFIGSKVTGSHEGGFEEFTGEFRTEGDRLADDGIEVVIQTDSLWSDSQRLTGHLKNKDFFDVERYPTAEFVSTAVKPADDGWSLTGDLTLHGVTKSITFPAQVQVKEDAVRLTSEFSINRFDFDITYKGKADDLIRKEVVIKLAVKATPGEATAAAGE